MSGEPNACAASSTIGRPKRGQLGERRRPAEQVDGHDRLRARRDPALDVLRIEVQRHRVDVGEDGRRLASRDRLGGRVEGEGRADHLVAATDAERVEDEHDRVGAVGDADRLGDAEVLGRLRLEGRDVRPEDELAALEHVGEGLLQLRDQRRVLRLDVDERDLHGRMSLARLGCGLFAPPHDLPRQVRRPCHEQRDDRVVDVAERVVEVLPAGCRAPSRRPRGRSTRSPSRAASAACSGGTAPRRCRPGSTRTSGRPA